MFDGQDVLSLEGDHLDISYRAEASGTPPVANAAAGPR